MKTARTSPCGACWPRRSLPETICGTCPKATLEILTNKEVIAVDQDRLGIEGFKYSAKDNIEIWFKPLADDAWAMCVLNRGATPQKFTFDWNNEKVTDDLSKRDARFDTTTYGLRDLWTKKRPWHHKGTFERRGART